MKRKTPDQIRRETVPAKYYGVSYGFLSAVLGGMLWFGGWGFGHPEEVRRYPEYVRHAARTEMEGFSLLGKTKRREGMSAEALRYALLRYGNRDHRFDPEIIRHGWYPKGVNPQGWVSAYGGVTALYSTGPLGVFIKPLTGTALTFLVCLVAGLIRDYRYHAAIIAGVPFEGSLVSTVKEYNTEIKGDGMGYVVQPWKDR